MKWSRLFWIVIVSGVIVLGGAAWLSARRLPAPGATAADQEERAAGERGAPLPRPGAREATPGAARASDTSAVGVTGSASPSPSPSGSEPAPATEGTRPAGAAALEAGEEGEPGAPAPRPRPKDAPRVNPTSGELMWSARDVIPDGGRPDEPLCGGKVCQPGQFCCGPPECGRCAYPMAGPRCPSVCPAQKSN